MVESGQSNINSRGNFSRDKYPVLIDYAIIVGLKGIKRRRRAAIFVILFFPVLAIMVGHLTGWRGDDYQVGFISVLIAFLVAYNACVMSVCPRCGFRFFYKPKVWSPFRRTCVHCALSLNFPWNPSESQWRAAERWIKLYGGEGAIPDMGMRCPRCNYDLTGLVDRRCPECGVDFDMARLMTIDDCGSSGSSRN